MIRKKRLLRGIGAALLLGAVGVGVWYFFVQRTSAPRTQVEVTVEKSAYAVGEPVRAIVRNVAKDSVNVADGFTIEQQDGARWEKATVDGATCATSLHPLIFGERRDLQWDGTLYRCDSDKRAIAVGQPKPGVYRFAVGFIPAGVDPTLADRATVVSASFTLSAPSADANTNVPSSAGNTNVSVTEPAPSTAECSRDADCAPAGCSSELCAKKGSKVFSACGIQKEYTCLKLTTCGCVSGMCAWADTAAYRSCLQSVGGP